MKRTVLSLIFAACLLPLASCSDKPAEQAQDAEAPTEAVAQNTPAAQSAGAAETATPAADGHEIPPIRSRWASIALEGIQGGKTAGIDQFALAFCNQYPNYKPNAELAEYIKSPKTYNHQKTGASFDDMKRNGYYACFLADDLPWNTICCYWKRNNGHRLVAFYLIETQDEWEQTDQLLAFYDFDPATGIMTPEPDLTKMIEDTAAPYDVYHITLPSEGKDIGLLCHNIVPKHDRGREVIINFRWNGNGFDKEIERDMEIG